MSGFDLAIAESHDGETYAFLLPHIPDDAPDAVREGLARRRITAVEGTCPCGARLVLPNRAARRAAKRAGQVLDVHVEHEDDCPAITDALQRWQR